MAQYDSSFIQLEQVVKKGEPFKHFDLSQYDENNEKKIKEEELLWDSIIHLKQLLNQFRNRFTWLLSEIDDDIGKDIGKWLRKEIEIQRKKKNNET